jgi:hypothetical protein
MYYPSICFEGMYKKVKSQSGKQISGLMFESETFPSLNKSANYSTATFGFSFNNECDPNKI